MFIFNKTSQFISSLTPEHFQDMLKTVISRSRNELIKTTRERNEKRQEILLKNQKEKQDKLQSQRDRETKRRSDLTSIIIDAGLWQTRSEVDEKMTECESDNERHLALKKQIQFRRVMLCQYIPDDKKFSFTRKPEGSNRYMNVPWQELRLHLFKFIDAAQSVQEGISVQRTVPEDVVAIPLLKGKAVIHYFIEGAERTPYHGKVISQVPGFPNWFNIKYDGDSSIYSYRLVDDYKEGNLEIVVE